MTDPQPPNLNTPVLHVYLARLYSLALAVREGCDDVFARAPAKLPNGSDYFKVEPGTLARIDGILVDAANIRRLLVERERGSKESARSYNFRVCRTEMFALLLRGVATDSLLDANLRNSLEHFDEYLDKYAAADLAGERIGPGMAAYNIVVSRLDAIEIIGRGPAYPLRVYSAGERVYYNFDRKVDLNRLREQASAVAERLRQLPSLQREEEPGGMLVVLRPAKAPTAK
jgi:hypothetical protein